MNHGVLDSFHVLYPSWTKEKETQQLVAKENSAQLPPRKPKTHTGVVSVTTEQPAWVTLVQRAARVERGVVLLGACCRNQRGLAVGDRTSDWDDPSAGWEEGMGKVK